MYYLSRTRRRTVKFFDYGFSIKIFTTIDITRITKFSILARARGSLATFYYTAVLNLVAGEVSEATVPNWQGANCITVFLLERKSRLLELLTFDE